MINHARTLLMNVDGPARPSELGEEFIPAAYRTVTLPPELQAVRSVLFGSSPDRLYLNYRIRQLIGLLHSTELVDHVLALDPRITYWPDTQERLLNAEFAPRASWYAGATRPVSFVGDNLADDYAGISRSSWLVTFPVENIAVVQRTKNPRTSVDVTYATGNGLTGPIPLHGSRLSIQVGTGGANIGAEGLTGLKLSINTLARPSTDIGAIVATLEQSLDRMLLNRVFYGDAGGDPKYELVAYSEHPMGLTEPLATFRQLWEHHPLAAYRLGGLLLAVIYRTETLRTGK